MAMITHGAFTYQDCKAMPWEQYEHLRVKTPQQIEVVMKHGR